MNKEKILKQRERAIDFIYYAATLSAIIAIGLYWYQFGGRNLSSDTQDWAVFGDFIGGTLNPIFAFFSFVLLLLTLSMQRKQLDKTEEQLELNREELKLTREELKKAADAQIDSAKLMSEQLKTQFLQQFDSLFFALLEQLLKALANTNFNNSISHQIKLFHMELYICRKEPNFEVIQNSCLDLIYIILDVIKSRFESKKNYLEDDFTDLKKNYFLILRTIIPNNILLIMIRNYSIQNETNHYSNILTFLDQAEFFESISIENLDRFQKYWFFNMLNKISPIAFGGNLIAKNYFTSIFYQKIEEESLDSFLFKVLKDQCKFCNRNNYYIFHNGELVLNFYPPRDGKPYKLEANNTELTDFEIAKDSLYIYFIVKNEEMNNVELIINFQNVEGVLKVCGVSNHRYKNRFYIDI